MERLIFISPHLDDAVLSCGGLIANLCSRYRIEVWTLFCGRPIWPRRSPLVKWLHSVSNARSASELLRTRKEEDKNASKILGASTLHFSFLDCVYRLKTLAMPLYPNSCIGEVDSKDQSLVEKIFRSVKNRVRADDIIFCPLGVGNHVDHIVTRRAIARIEDIEVGYYQDIPYAVTTPDTDKLDYSMQRVQLSLNPMDLERWLKATREYKSQLKMLDPDNCILKGYITRFELKPFSCFVQKSASNRIEALFEPAIHG